MQPAARACSPRRARPPPQQQRSGSAPLNGRGRAAAAAPTYAGRRVAARARRRLRRARRRRRRSARHPRCPHADLLVDTHAVGAIRHVVYDRRVAPTNERAAHRRVSTELVSATAVWTLTRPSARWPARMAIASGVFDIARRDDAAVLMLGRCAPRTYRVLTRAARLRCARAARLLIVIRRRCCSQFDRM